MPFTFGVLKNDIAPALSKAAAAAKNPLPVFRAMGTTFKSITEGTFNSVGADMRPSPWPAKKDGTPSNLQKSTTLAKSFNLEVTNSYAALSTPVVYARIHQFGGTIKGNPWLRFQYAPGRWATKAAVTIPPRPFFPVLNGKLTPKAYDLIARAGHRALARQIGATD